MGRDGRAGSVAAARQKELGTRTWHVSSLRALGAVAPNGIGIDRFWDNLVHGVSGVATITRFDASKHDVQIAGEVKGFDPLQWVEKKEVRKMDLFIQYAIAAAQMAFDDAGLKVADDNRERMGVFVGTGMGGIPALEESHRILLERGPGRVSAFFIPSIITNLGSGQISMRFGMKGPNSCVCTACATGNHAIGDSFRIIQRGEADVMIAGGSEAVITPLTIAGFSSMRALSTRNERAHSGQPALRQGPGRFRDGRGQRTHGAGDPGARPAARRPDLRRAGRVRHVGGCPSHHVAGPGRGGTLDAVVA